MAEHIDYHKDGTVCARGTMHDGVMDGDWQWYRKDGTLKRSGSFINGQQCGKWTTYDKTGAPYKVTVIKPKPA